LSNVPEREREDMASELVLKYLQSHGTAGFVSLRNKRNDELRRIKRDREGSTKSNGSMVEHFDADIKSVAAAVNRLSREWPDVMVERALLLRLDGGSLERIAPMVKASRATLSRVFARLVELVKEEEDKRNEENRPVHEVCTIAGIKKRLRVRAWRKTGGRGGPVSR